MHSNKKNIKARKDIVKNTQSDHLLFILVSFLIIISIIFSYSLTIYTVEYYEVGQYYFFIRQFLVGIVSILIMWFFSKISPDILVNKVGMTLFILFALIMIIMPLLPSNIVPSIGGASRWIKLYGFSLSPIEFFKIGFIYFLSWSFHRRIIDVSKKITFKNEFILLFPYFLTFVFVVFFVAFLQKDLGQIVLLGFILFILLIFANRSYKIFLFLGITGVGILVSLILIFPYRLKRIYSWWAMVQDDILQFLPYWMEHYLRIAEIPAPYQVSHSLNAIHNGGIFGKGIGLGDIKLGFLSDVHTDFILAGITEELGLFGLFFIVFIMIMIIWRILKISQRVTNQLYHLFTVGISLMIMIAFLINAYGVSGMIPIKGIAVPLLSYGGSSMISMAISIGLVLSISRTIKYKNKKKS